MSRPNFHERSYSSSSSSTSEAMCLTPSSRASSSDLSALERQDGQPQASSPSDTLTPGSATPQEGTVEDSHAIPDGVELPSRDDYLASMAILLLIYGFILSLYVLCSHSQSRFPTRLAIRVMLIAYVCLFPVLLIVAAVICSSLSAGPPGTIDKHQAHRTQVIRFIPLLVLGIFLLAAGYLSMILGLDWLASAW